MLETNIRIISSRAAEDGRCGARSNQKEKSMMNIIEKFLATDRQTGRKKR